MIPDKGGRYWAREVSYDMLNQKIYSLPSMVDVVEGVPNPRNHRLFVRTGAEHPKYRALTCYEWGPPSPREIENMEAWAAMFKEPRPVLYKGP